MENQPGSIRYNCKSFVKHGCHHTQNRPFRDGIADQIPVVQIQNRRKIKFLAKQTELCHIGDPLLIWLFCVKISVQQIGRNLAHISFVRAIFFHSDMTNQSQLLHESLYCLVVQIYSSAAKRNRDTPVAIPTFIFVVDSRNLCLCLCVFICPVHPLSVVVEGGTGQLSDFKQNRQWIFRPQFLDYQGFFLWRRSRSKTKACKFFKYSFSARSL